MKYGLNKMEIINGNTYINRTLSYLVPCLKHYGNSLAESFNKVSILSWGIGDFHISDDLENCSENDIYCLIDTNGKMKYNTYINKKYYSDYFKYFLEDLKENYIYKTDYIYSKNPEYHILVFNIPGAFKNIKVKFINGEYSTMYTADQIEEYILRIIKVRNVEVESEAYKILTKSNSRIEEFHNKIREDFNITSPITLNTDMELDYPPELKSEIFNYQKNKNGKASIKTTFNRGSTQ